MSTLFRPVSLVVLVFFTGIGLAFSQEQLGQPLPDNLGTTVEREEGGFVNVRIVGGRFRVYFLDKDSKLVEPVYPMGIIRYAVKKEYNRKITITLNQSEGKPYLDAVRVTSPPYRYYLTLILTQDVDAPIPGLPEKETFSRILVNQL